MARLGFLRRQARRTLEPASGMMRELPIPAGLQETLIQFNAASAGMVLAEEKFRRRAHQRDHAFHRHAV
jgi:hypothetical protein